LNDNVKDVQLTETVTTGTLIEPQPTPPSQFPTPSKTLRKDEFFIYVYQVTAPAAAVSPDPAVMISLDCSLPVLSAPLTTQVEVVTEEEAQRREGGQRLKDCGGEPTEDEQCVDLADLTLSFVGNALNSVDSINLNRTRHFKYTLDRTAELLECIRASLLAEVGSPRPGQFFMTFKDIDPDPPQPVGPTAAPGSTAYVSNSGHVHELLRDNNSGLEWADNRIRIDGPVGGGEINFLNTVSGQDPALSIHLATKAYVDDSITARITTNIDWQNSVLDKDLTAPPAIAHHGDRYLLFSLPTGAWTGHRSSIATLNGTEWVFTEPNEGTAVFVEDENIAYLFYENLLWLPFLAMPDVTAGNGLIANGAALSVGQGAGVVVDLNNVSVNFDTNAPSNIAATAAQPINSNKVSQSNHVHALLLEPDGGLRFNSNRLLVDGRIKGQTIQFLETVSGKDPIASTHLTTKNYVDSLIDTKLDQLTWQDSVIDKKLAVPPAPTLGARYLLFSTTLSGAWSGHTNQIAIGTGTAWRFITPELGMFLFVESELTYYYFANNQWDTIIRVGREIEAGDGLSRTADTFSVNAGDGLMLADKKVMADFSTDLPQPVAALSSIGNAPTLSRSDHVHAWPDFMNSATGVVSFRTPKGFTQPLKSGPIFPNLGRGLISIILGLEKVFGDEGENEVFIGDPEMGRVSKFDNIYLASDISHAFTSSDTNFRVLVRPGNISEGREIRAFRVRWYAYGVGADQGVTEVESTEGPDQ
jgi:hypothetical protein